MLTLMFACSGFKVQGCKQALVFIGRTLHIWDMTVIKYHLSLPVAAGAIFVAVPYSISLLAQWLYGWPNEPGYRKYIEALKPRRVYSLTRAVLEILKHVQYSRLYFHWKSWYKDVSNNKHCVKGVPFGRRGNKLDLYHSPSWGKSESELLLVVVFVYGGAWGSGERSMYCLLAHQLAKELNASVICPDYSTYPKGNVLDMVQDLCDSLIWVRENGRSFHLDADNVVLIGHSAGAHLCMLTALFLVEALQELFTEPFSHRELTDSIKGIIGLSGVYDIMDHYLHEKMRAVEHVSTMHKAMAGIENFHYYSPTVHLKTLNKEQLRRVPPVAVIHGTSDITVPVSSSEKLRDLLASLSVSVTLYLLPGLNHAEMVTDLMAEDRRFYHTIFVCVKQEYSKFQN